MHICIGSHSMLDAKCEQISSRFFCFVFFIHRYFNWFLWMWLCVRAPISMRFARVRKCQRKLCATRKKQTNIENLCRQRLSFCPFAINVFMSWSGMDESKTRQEKLFFLFSCTHPTFRYPADTKLLSSQFICACFVSWRSSASRLHTFLSYLSFRFRFVFRCGDHVRL